MGNAQPFKTSESETEQWPPEDHNPSIWGPERLPSRSIHTNAGPMTKSHGPGGWKAQRTQERMVVAKFPGQGRIPKHIPVPDPVPSLPRAVSQSLP